MGSRGDVTRASRRRDRAPRSLIRGGADDVGRARAHRARIQCECVYRRRGRDVLCRGRRDRVYANVRTCVAVGRTRSVGRRATPSRARGPRETRARAMDDLARHRATLGLDLARDASTREVKAAFKRAARAAHPDLAGCAVKFREVVAARDALLGLERGLERGAARAGGRAAATGGAGGRAFAAVLATPFFVAAMVSTALPKSNEGGANAEMGRVHGWMNAPVNAWLKEDGREPGDGNRERFWKTGRVNAK